MKTARGFIFRRKLVPERSEGFTLIELLLVITLLAIIFTIALAVYGEAQKGSRDTRRKQDLRSIAAALEIYYQKNGRYPCTDYLPTAWQKSSNDTVWIKDQSVGGSCGGKDLDTNYIDKVPQDPINSNPTDYPWLSNKFSYAYWSGYTNLTSPSCNLNAGQYYILITKLEKSTDPQTALYTTYNYCDGPPGGPTKIINTNIIPSGAADANKLYIITSSD